VPSEPAAEPAVPVGRQAAARDGSNDLLAGRDPLAGPDLLGSPDLGRLYLLCAVVLTGTVASIAFHYVMGFYLLSGHPYDTFLFLPADRFQDFFNVFRDVQVYGAHLHTLAYSPFMHVVVAALTLIPRMPAFALLLVVFSATCAAQVCSASPRGSSRYRFAWWWW
jgi:hypothetical protein